MALVQCRTVLFIILLIPVFAIAAVPAWQIVPNKSAITFTATQNNSPVSGQFKSFTGQINFDPTQLDKSNISIVVDMGSVTTSYTDVADTLKTADWFDIKLFPQAVFKTSSFVKTGENTYEAKGMLTIRDKTLLVTLAFTLEKYSNTEARVKGSTKIKRTVFGIGKGDWASTDEVKDEVEVDFTLSAIK